MSSLLRILIVAGSEAEAGPSLAVLRAAFAELRVAHVAEAAALPEELARGEWDLVLAWPTAPELPPWQVLAILGRNAPAVPLILMTGRLDEDSAVSLLRAGTADFVQLDEGPRLRVVVERSLRDSRLRRDDARVLQLATVQARRSAVLGLLGRQALESRDLLGLLAAAVRLTQEALDATLCGILEPDPNAGGAMRWCARRGWPGEGAGGDALALGAGGLEFEALRHAGPMCVEDFSASTAPQLPAVTRDRGVRSGLAVSIRSPAHVFGLLEVLSDRRAAFGPADGEFVEAVAGLLAAAIERFHADAAPAVGDDRFRAFLEEARGISIFMLDAGGRILSWNRGAERLFGYAAAEIVGARIDRLYPPGDVELGKPDIDLRLAAEVGQFEEEDWRVRRDGGRIWANTVLNALPAGPGAGPGFAVITRDVTERKDSSEALRVSEEKFRSIVQHMPDVVWTGDAAGVWHFVSANAERVLGFAAAELMAGGTTAWLDRVNEADRAAERTAYQALFESGKEYAVEYRFQAKDGQWRWLLGRAAAVYEKDGRLLADGTCSDITEKKRLEGQLLRSQRMESIGTLAGGVAHDLNNILTPILISAPLLREESLPAESVTKLLETIEINAQRGSDIVRQLLTFGRGVGGERVVVQLRHLIKDMIKVAEETFPKQITLRSRVDDNLWPMLGDPTQIHQVLLNLCINARDAMPAGGEIAIHAENAELDAHFTAQHAEARPGAHVTLRVTDTGEGMPPEIMDKIFDPFFTTKEIGKGTGLGLATVLGIVKSHGAIIQVASEVGRGTAFTLFFPASPDLAASTDHKWEEEPPPTGHGELVLLVDDEPGVLEATRQLLHRSNYRVMTARDGVDALTVLERHPGTIQILVTDLMMPRMDGVALIHAATKREPGLKVLAITGLEQEERSAEVLAAGAAAVLAKPFTARKLLHALRDLTPNSPGAATGGSIEGGENLRTP